MVIILIYKTKLTTTSSSTYTETPVPLEPSRTMATLRWLCSKPFSCITVTSHSIRVLPVAGLGQCPRLRHADVRLINTLVYTCWSRTVPRAKTLYSVFYCCTLTSTAEVCLVARHPANCSAALPNLRYLVEIYVPISGMP